MMVIMVVFMIVSFVKGISVTEAEMIKSIQEYTGGGPLSVFRANDSKSGEAVLWDV